MVRDQRDMFQQFEDAFARVMVRWQALCGQAYPERLLELVREMLREFFVRLQSAGTLEMSLFEEDAFSVVQCYASSSP